MIRSIFFLLCVPVLSFSQGLEGGSVDNDKDDLIARLVINQEDPSLDEPVSDIILFEKSIIAYSGGILYSYDFDSEKTTPLIDMGFGSAKFVQLAGTSLYINFYDLDGNFKICYHYDLSAADPNNGVIEEFGEELVEIFFYNSMRYIVVEDQSTSDFYKLAYATKLGSGLVINETRLLPKDYQIRIDSKGFVFTIIAPVGKPTERRMSYIDSADPVNIKSIGITSDASFSFVNDQAFYSVDKEIFKIGSETGYATTLLEDAIREGITQATNFFTLGTTIFGYYVKNSDGSRNVVLAETGGQAAVGNYKYVNLFETAAYLNFAKTIVSIKQAGNSHIAISNFSGSSFQTLVVDVKGDIVNDVPQEPLKIITSFPINKATVFEDKYLALHFQQVGGGKVDGSLGYLNLDSPASFAFDQMPTSEDVGYDFEPSFATSRTKSYVVFNTSDNGFELYTLSDKTQSGYLLAEEITNDELSQIALEKQLVKDVLPSYSTYPERLITYNNTLYYLAHLASGKFDGYSYLYKVNKLPSNMALSSSTVSEAINSTTAVANIGAVDLDDSDFSYALVAGSGSDNNASFNIVGSSLRTSGGFNYEVDSTLTIRMRVTDPHGASYQKVFALKVTNANDTPTGISLSGDKIGENVAVGTKIADISTEDEDVNDSFTYTLVDDAGGAFAIIGNELLTNQTYNEATQNQYTITIRTEDKQAAMFEQDFLIGITESNTVPNNIFLSSQDIPENASNEQLVGELTTEDADPEDTDFTYELVEGTGSDHNASFVIDNTATPPLLKATSVFDFETTSVLSIRVSTTDPKGANFAKQFQINVTDVNDGPTEVLLLADSIAENQPTDTKIGTLATVDVDNGDSFSYSLIAGAGDTNNADFTIDNTSGDLLQAIAGFDFETKNEYSIRVASTDSGGETTEGVLTIRILDLNEAPSALTITGNTVNEEDASAIVGELEVVDPDVGDTYTISLPDTLDNSFFELAAGGLLGLSDAVNFEDANLPNPLSVLIRAADGGGESILQDFSITVNDIDDPIDSIAVVGNPIFSGEITTDDILGVINIFDDELINVSDYDRSLYVTNKFDNTGDDLTDDTKFNIIYNSSVGTFGQYQIKAIQNLLYNEALDNVYDFSITVTNGGVTAEKQVVFEVKNPSENIRPTVLILSDSLISENKPENRLIGVLSTDDPNDNDTFSYTLKTGAADNSLFEIEGNELLVKASTVLNFTEKTNYQIVAEAVETNTDESFSVSSSFTIRVVEFIDTESPVFDESAQPSNIVSDGAGISLSLGINDWKLVNVQFQKASILSSTFDAPEDATYNDATETVDIAISENDFDAFGMKLKIIATDEAGNQGTSETFYVYRSLSANNIYSELPTEYLGQGRLTTDFKMFSIPYRVNDLGVKVFLERQLGVALGSETFQVFQYNPSTGDYTNGVSLNVFEQGKAYWFTTVVENPQINFGAGELYPYKAEFEDDSVFVFKLKRGWNQVGNPYPVALNWTNLIEGTAIGQLQVFNEGTYATSDTLPVYGGGFVLVQEDIDLAAVINENGVQRVAKPTDFIWKTDLQISQNGLQNRGSIGMHEQASTELDHFDVANPPHFSEYLEIDFNKTARYYTNYKQDVVDPQSYYSWVFEINSHKKDSPLKLSWSSKGLMPSQLFLVDLETLIKVDMSKVQHYISNSGGTEGFRVIYSADGELFNLGSLLVGVPVPNPTKRETSISINLPESNQAYEVTAEVVDLQGRSVMTLHRNSVFNDGFHTLSWDGNTKYGDPAASGIYLYRIKIKGTQSGVFTRRILKQN